MPPKKEDVAKFNISPVLFMTEDGVPMTFFLRPGQVKRRLHPLIVAGAGMLCNVQQPGAILLIDPEEKDSIPDSTAHWYVSTQYILDCIEKNEQLNLEDYRLNPEVVQKQSARLNNNKDTLAGRAAYTSEEDAAILSYVSKRIKEVGGNRLWQEMEKQRVTSHSWQSMKYRYKVRLAKKQPEDVEVEDTDVQKPSGAEDAACPQTHSADSDRTQIDAQSTSANGTEPDNVEAQTSISPQEEVKPQTDERPAESTPVETVEAETSNSLQPEALCLDPQTDAESAELETDEAQTIISVPEDSPPAQLESRPNTSSQKKPKEKQKASPEVEQPQRRVTRRQLVLDELSLEPYAKKLRSSAPSPGQPSSSPQPLKKTKSAIKSALQKDTKVEQPPLKRARKSVAESPQEESPREESPREESPREESPWEESPREESPREESPREESPREESPREESPREESPREESPREESPREESPQEESPLEESSQEEVPEEESPEEVPEEESPEEESPQEEVPEEESPQEENPQEESGDTAASETAKADTESNPVPQKGEKKEKRKLGILEYATKEFEDESESDEDGTPDLQNPSETAMIQPTSKEPPLPAAEHGPTLQENLQESQASSSNSLPKTGCPKPAATEPAAAKAVSETNKAHLFIFDSESQEEESQSVVAAPSKPQPTVNKDAALSLTQVQLEEDKQLIRELMKQTNQDLISVTKALLKTSGDVSAALEQLLNPSATLGPLWNHHDDSLLLSADPAVRQQLQEKYSEEDVAKRIMFLEVQG